LQSSIFCVIVLKKLKASEKDGKNKLVLKRELLIW